MDKLQGNMYEIIEQLKEVVAGGFKEYEKTNCLSDLTTLLEDVTETINKIYDEAATDNNTENLEVYRDMWDNIVVKKII